MRRVGASERRSAADDDAAIVLRRVEAVPMAVDEREVDDAFQCLAALLLDRRARLAASAAMRHDAPAPRRKAA
jgi:hypothetical protein